MKHLLLSAALVAAALTINLQGDAAMAAEKEQAVLGGGCFWCMEAMFEQLAGVEDVVSGFAGGNDHASYKEVCSGATGHAEVIRVTYDPAVISYQQILGAFFAAHDPTTMNRQGADVGAQYRSVIFCADKEQTRLAEEAVAKLTRDKVFKNPIVTQIQPLTRFFAAEDHHQDYFRRNRTQGYCQVVINPKLKKFRQEFAGMLKD